MENQFNFALCLSQLLNILNINNIKLAKAVNVDPSLVSKWKTGKRKFDVTSNYLNLISSYLSENVISNYQYEDILIIAKNSDLYISIDIYKNTNLYINELLVSSLGEPCEEKKSSKLSSSQKTDALGYGYINTYKMILGHKNVITAGIELLKSLTKKPNYITDPILITFFTEIDSFSNFEEANEEWNNALQEVQNKGWNIHKLISITENKNRNKKIIDELLLNIETKMYDAYHLNNYDYFFHFKELIFVPKVGALLCLFGSDFEKIDSAFLFTDNQALTAFDMISKQCRAKAVPLITKSYSDMNIESLLEVFKYEEFNGNRYSFNCFINYLTTPIEFYERNLSSYINNNPEADYTKFLYYNKKLKETLKYQLDCYFFNNIYSKKSIESFLKNHRNYCKLFTNTDSIKIIEYIIYLIENFEHFNIAFLNDNDSYILNNFSWIVKESNAVIINNLTKGKNNGNKVCVTITEPNIVNTFTEYFLQLWRNIAPINKDKKSVVGWLKTELKSLNYMSLTE